MMNLLRVPLLIPAIMDFVWLIRVSSCVYPPPTAMKASAAPLCTRTRSQSQTTCALMRHLEVGRCPSNTTQWHTMEYAIVCRSLYALRFPTIAALWLSSRAAPTGTPLMSSTAAQFRPWMRMEVMRMGQREVASPWAQLRASMESKTAMDTTQCVTLQL